MNTRTLRRMGLGLVVGIASTCAASPDNLVENGSFELPLITQSCNWDIFDSIPGWQLSRGEKIEIQRGVGSWDAYDGAQWLELDSDLDGPGGLHGEPASAAVFQDLGTVIGQAYDLTFAFSSRPGVDDNALEIVWGGEVVDTLSASGTGRHNTDWHTYTYVLTATADVTRLEFGDRSVSDSLGTFVDDVSVSTHVPEPASIAVLGTGTAMLLSTRRW